jgi:hypothetical protein
MVARRRPGPAPGGARSEVERDDARRWAVRLDGLLASAQAGQASQALLCERAEQDRDRALQRLSSCSAENSAYRQQRDRALTALEAVLTVLEKDGLRHAEEQDRDRALQRLSSWRRGCRVPPAA